MKSKICSNQTSTLLVVNNSWNQVKSYNEILYKLFQWFHKRIKFCNNNKDWLTQKLISDLNKYDSWTILPCDRIQNGIKKLTYISSFGVWLVFSLACCRMITTHQCVTFAHDTFNNHNTNGDMLWLTTAQTWHNIIKSIHTPHLRHLEINSIYCNISHTVIKIQFLHFGKYISQVSCNSPGNYYTNWNYLINHFIQLKCFCSFNCF